MSDGLGDPLNLTKRAKPGRPGLPGGSHKLTIMVDEATHALLLERAGKRSMGAVVREVLRAGLAAQRIE